MKFLQVRAFWYCIFVIKVAVGLTIPNENRQIGELASRFDKITKYTSKERVKAAIPHHFPAYCPKKRNAKITTSSRPMPTAEMENVNYNMAEAKVHNKTLKHYFGKVQNEHDWNRPPNAYQFFKAGAQYFFRCPRGGAQDHTVEWKAHLVPFREGVQHTNIQNVWNFGTPLFQGQNSPWLYGNYFISVYCTQFGAHRCEHSIVGYYQGEVWPHHMTMYFSNDRNDPQMAPAVFQTCQVYLPGYPPGPVTTGYCEIDRLNVYAID
ncbi:protein of unknown function [Taphrina deformans PYCC 5710]|uniref:Uncharacterized protein n=1 Tax=Taphrina deformans (strain PYCC 5710 / ATCC 11124 / CBS 356.35 / IMI 108563 / JCM 9778 / NBRC 8474) TaxID=1097556 RepID=R4XJU8_TAPDE|nr:protein of unknown function [Taphrina deformans PYCC 5710]|eukprot:CCG84713.1 protein of unknown function [Taphrina deformans PYCC 5710]